MSARGCAAISLAGLTLVGDPRSAGACVRGHRGRVAGRRPLRRPRRAAAVRRAGELARARHGADGGGRGSVGGHGRRDLVPRGDAQFAAFTAGLALTTGVAALVAGLLRLGFLANFISQPVLKGFIIGLALTIIIGQLPKLFGISRGTGDFFEQPWHLVTHLGDTQALTLLVGTLSLAVIIGLRRLAPAFPGSLVAVAGGIAAVKVLGLDVPTVGSIASGLPSLGLPDIGLADVGALAAGGIGVMLIAFAEGLGAAKAYAARGNQRIDANRELVALGSANLASGLSSGMVVSGSLSKTAVNASAGARTQLSGLLAARPDRRGPALPHRSLRGPPRGDARRRRHRRRHRAHRRACPGRALRHLHQAPRPPVRLGRTPGLHRRRRRPARGARLRDAAGLFIGIGVSLLLLIYRASRPYVAVLGRTPGPDGAYRDIDRHHDARPTDGIVVLRIESGLYFANAENVRSRILDVAAAEGVHAVILDAETTPFVDISAARMLVALHEELRDRGVRLVLARAVGQVRDLLGCTTDDRRPDRVLPDDRTPPSTPSPTR